MGFSSVCDGSELEAGVSAGCSVDSDVGKLVLFLIMAAEVRVDFSAGGGVR